ncbi:MAG: S1-like domain-containing RNA-binding protein [Bacteroides sp.]|nr:S1-like domain-containing RNA-binding protein [Bacteroides sp.]
MSIELGRFNWLAVVKEVDFGVYLDGGEEGEILLPARYVPEEIQVGEEIRVFIYLDMEERLVATTLTPYIQVGEFANLEVSWVNQYGAFLNWGLMKDLFVPFREQKVKMEKGNRYMVYAYVDEESFRIIASAKIEKFLSKEPPPYKAGDEVNLLIWQKTDLGYKVIVENRYSGMLFNNEIFRTDIRSGLRLSGFIKQVREDGKIDLTLQSSSRENLEDFSMELLAYIRNNGGKIALGDKSPAEDIYATFSVSKKIFKKAVGDLYKRCLIRLEEDGGISLA